MKKIDLLAMAILVIAGIVFGIRGLLSMDVLAKIAIKGSPLARVIDVLFGAAALYIAFSWRRLQKRLR